MSENSFEKKVNQLREEANGFHDVASEEVVEKTAVRLLGLNYSPPVIAPIERFLRLTKKGLLEEIDKVLAMQDQEACALAPNEPMKCQDLRIQFISVLIFYYKKLMLLRQGDIETWEEIDELYVHD